MSDSVKAWHDMLDEEKLKTIEESNERRYLWVLDFEEGRVSVSYTHLTLPTN